MDASARLSVPSAGLDARRSDGSGEGKLVRWATDRAARQRVAAICGLRRGVTGLDQRQRRGQGVPERPCPFDVHFAHLRAAVEEWAKSTGRTLT